jgi:hypothetical protein
MAPTEGIRYGLVALLLDEQLVLIDLAGLVSSRLTSLSLPYNSRSAESTIRQNENYKRPGR